MKQFDVGHDSMAMTVMMLKNSIDLYHDPDSYGPMMMMTMMMMMINNNMTMMMMVMMMMTVTMVMVRVVFTTSRF